MWKGKSKSGKDVVLLNPSEKGGKFARELKEGFHRTNDGHYKLDDNGKGLKLDKTARAYRSGYLDARKDSAAAYKAKKSKKY